MKMYVKQLKGGDGKMEKLTELISCITTKHKNIVQKITEQLSEIESDISRLETEMDQQNILNVESQEKQEGNQDIFHKKIKLQEEKESILRVKNQLSQFFTDDWQELKSVLAEKSAQKLQEEKTLHKKLDKIHSQMQMLKNEERGIQEKIASVREINLLNHVSSILIYMPIELDTLKLFKQPQYIQDEVFWYVIHEKELPDRLKKLF